mgnify:CR=1 FL=1
MTSISKILYFIVFSMINIIPVMGYNIITDVTEFAVDLTGGMFVATCESSVTCTYFMYFVVIIMLFTLSIYYCINGPVVLANEYCTTRNARRGLNNYAGYKIGKGIFG